jgi:hypothetical protein
VGIGDIVAVNGAPAKGIVVTKGLSVPFRLAPTHGQAVADAMRGGMWEEIWDIHQCRRGAGYADIVT